MQMFCTYSIFFVLFLYTYSVFSTRILHTYSKMLSLIKISFEGLLLRPLQLYVRYLNVIQLAK